MTLRFFLTVALLCGLQPASAADIRVLSGEHEGFSRLVVLLPKGTGWKLQEAPEGRILDVDESGLRYALDPVFEYIPRTRITNVRQIEGSADIRIDTIEASVTEAFALQSGAVVIDVKDAPPPATVIVAPKLPEVHPYGAFPRRQDRLSLYWKDVAPLAPTTIEAPPPSRLQSFASEDPRIKQAEVELLEQLGRAAAQGLIHVSPTQVSIDAHTARESLTETSAPPDRRTAVTTDHLAVTVETSIDRDWKTQENGVEISGTGVRCAPDADFDIATWRGEQAPSELIGAGRRELLGEFDRPRSDAVLQLAQSYLSIGFGAEALQVLGSYEIDNSQADNLDFIARIVDGRPVDTDSQLLAMTDCNGKVALWAVLGAIETPEKSQVRLGAVQRAFAALPAEVRAIVGPRLVDRLLEMGAGDIAATARSALVRTPGDYAERISLVEARLERAEGNHETADTRLEGLIGKNSEAAAEALAALVDGRLANDRPIDDATIAQAGALAFELGGSTEGLALLRAHILGHGSVGRFDAAFEAMQRWRSEWDPALKTKVLNELYGQIARVPDEERFLTTYFGYQEQLEETDLPAATRLGLAERLISLGFAKHGREILGRAAHPTDTERLLFAKAALAERDAPAALTYLSTLSNPEASRLRGTAMQMLGEHGAALDEFQKADTPDLARAEAWRSGAWEQIMHSGSEEQKQFLSAYDIVSSTQPASDSVETRDPEGPLARANGLIARSAAERKALLDVLAQYPLPPSPADSSTQPGF